ncbi:hypothetical protein ACH5RR_038992 [Cinchona calisaya]|uniref:Uncharacterized protein n=1 Tax=Cinchona calisaya TaxID=153742 RepID=A0ABD2Y0D5_9GENT
MGSNSVNSGAPVTDSDKGKDKVPASPSVSFASSEHTLSGSKNREGWKRYGFGERGNDGEGAKSMGAGAVTIASAGAAVGIDVQVVEI